MNEETKQLVSNTLKRSERKLVVERIEKKNCGSGYKNGDQNSRQASKSERTVEN